MIMRKPLITPQELQNDIYNIYQVCPPAVKLLRFCAFLADQPIPLHLIRLHPEFTTTTINHLNNWFEFDDSNMHAILSDAKRQFLRDYLTSLKQEIPYIETQVKSLILEMVACIIHDLNRGIECDTYTKERISAGYLEHARSLLVFAEQYPPDVTHFTVLADVLASYNVFPPLPQPVAQQPEEKKPNEGAEAQPIRRLPAYPRLPASLFAQTYRAHTVNRLHHPAHASEPQQAQEGAKKPTQSSSTSYLGTLFAGMAIGGGAVAAALMIKNSSSEATGGFISSLTERLNIRK